MEDCVTLQSTASALTVGSFDVARLRRDFDTFQAVVGIGEEFLGASRLRSAAACAEIAAACAWRNHSGLFASPRLERLVSELGRRMVPACPGWREESGHASPRHVLHVMSKARQMGGDSRFACRWMQADGGRRHSVAITSQLDEAVPDSFLESSSRTGGQVHRLDADTRDPIVRARRLRALAAEADFVALHIYPDDIVPLLAFAHKRGLPPVAFVHHSDHTFWVGVDISDLVVQLRQCSVPLSVRRRDIAPERFATLPIPLPPIDRTQSRAAARAELDLRDDQVVLLSVGTEFKYAPAGGPGFLDVLRPLLDKHDDAVLLVVGPRQKGEWSAAYERTGGRIRALGKRYDTATLFQAADVYLDSFPFTSPTAALEAGSYGLPLVAYCPHTGDAQVLSPGAPGLDDSICACRDLEGYAASISELICDPGLRRQLGERARRAIDHHHRGPAWLDRLGDVYRIASAIAPRWQPPAEDRFEPDMLDVFISRLYGVNQDGLGQFIDQHVAALPLAARVAVLRRMLDVNRSFSFDMFLPRWCASRLSWRPPYWGAIRKMLAKHDPQPRTKPCESM
jgi:hypothetical protein